MFSYSIVTIHLQQWDWELRSKSTGWVCAENEIYETVDYLHEIQQNRDEIDRSIEYCNTEFACA